MAANTDITVTFSGAYGFDRLEKTIATLQPLLHLDEPAVINVNLDRLVHVGPTALALMVAAVKRSMDLGLLRDGSSLQPPRSALVRRYVERMNLLRELVGDMPEDFERHEPHGFRPCEHFDCSEDYWQVARSLSEALGERCNVDDTARGAIRVCLDEVCENVIHHADTTLGGFAAAQGWPKQGRRQFEIGIVDLGVGVRASLAKNEQYADIGDDAAAIAKALQPRVTATPERNAGIGLFVTSLLLALNGGHLLVRSGNGVAWRGATHRQDTLDAMLPGTLVAIRANIDRPLDLAPVYEALDRALDKLAIDRQAGPQDADHRDDDLQAR